MTREIFNPSNGNNITSVIGSRSGGTGVTTRDEVVQKFNLVGKETIGQPRGPVPLMSGKVPRKYIEGASENPYGLKIPTQVANKHSHQFPIEMCDAFTQYKAEVDHGHVFVRDSFIHYTPEAGYEGEVILTFEGSEFRFNCVEKLLGELIAVNQTMTVGVTDTTIAFEILELRYTDSSAANPNGFTLIDLLSNGVSKGKGDYRFIYDDSSKIAKLMVENGKEKEGIDEIIISPNLSGYENVQYKVRVPVRPLSGLYLESMSYGAGWLVTAASGTTMTRKVVTVNGGTRPGGHTRDINEVYQSGPVEIYRYDDDIERFKLVQTIVPPSGTLQEMSISHVSHDGDYVFIGSRKGPNGSLRGGFVDVYKWDESKKIYNHKYRLNNYMDSSCPNGGIFARRMYSDQRLKHLLVSSQATNNTPECALFIYNYETGDYLGKIFVPGNYATGFISTANWAKDVLMVTSLYSNFVWNTDNTKSGSYALFKWNGFSYSRISSGFSSTLYGFGGVFVDTEDSSKDTRRIVYCDLDNNIASARTGKKYKIATVTQNGVTFSVEKNIPTLFPWFPTNTVEVGLSNGVMDENGNMLTVAVARNSSWQDIDWSFVEFDFDNFVVINLGKDPKYMELKKRLVPDALNPNINRYKDDVWLNLDGKAKFFKL